MVKGAAGVIIALVLLMAGTAFGIELQPEKEYFLKTPLHVVRGDEIYWVNYTSKSVKLKAGEKVTVTEVRNHLVKFVLAGKEYSFAYTEKGHAGVPALYDKFFTKEDVGKEIGKQPQKIRDNIALSRVEIGMTKDQVLLSVGCPAIVDSQKTFNLTLKEIRAGNQWIFYHNRFNRWAVQFSNGKVISVKE